MIVPLTTVDGPAQAAADTVKVINIKTVIITLSTLVTFVLIVTPF